MARRRGDAEEDGWERGGCESGGGAEEAETLRRQTEVGMGRGESFLRTNPIFGWVLRWSTICGERSGVAGRVGENARIDPDLRILNEF